MERVIDGRGYRAWIERPKSSGRVGIVSEGEGAAARFLSATGDPCFDVSEYAGAPLGDAVAAAAGKDVFTFSVEDVDRLREEGLGAAQVHEETAAWRAHLPARAQDPANFLIRLFEGRLARLLPSAFGMLLVFEREDDASGFPACYLLTFRRGKLESFYEPEIEGLDPRNRVSIEAAAKQMGVRHALKVEAIVLSPREWLGLCQEPTARLAWKRFSASLRAGRARLVPFRLMLSSVIFLKGL